MTNNETDKSYIFLIDKREKYVIGTPNAMYPSDRTIDIKFQDFAENLEMQTDLKLLSSVLLSPSVNYAKPSQGQELYKGVAHYLSGLSNSKNGYEYLMNNGTLRILITDTELREKIFKKVA